MTRTKHTQGVQNPPSTLLCERALQWQCDDLVLSDRQLRKNRAINTLAQPQD